MINVVAGKGAGMDLSIVIPVYNEERRITEAVRRVQAFMALKEWEWELLVVNDGSTDGTDAVVTSLLNGSAGGRLRLLSSSAQNKGKGHAVRCGVLEARGRTLLVTDVDFSAPIKEMDKLMAALQEGYDAAVGSRAVRKEGCDVQQSFERRVAGRIFNFLVRLVALRGFKDTQCGFKCFTHKAAWELFSLQRLDGFCFDVEVLYLAKKKGFKVKEVPVMWKEGKGSKVSLFRDSLAMVKDLFWIRRYWGKNGV